MEGRVKKSLFKKRVRQFQQECLYIMTANIIYRLTSHHMVQYILGKVMTQILISKGQLVKSAGLSVCPIWDMYKLVLLSVISLLPVGNADLFIHRIGLSQYF